MKVFDIFFDWLKGLWAAGGILSRLVAIFGVLVGMVILIIAIILNFGIKLFKIFWDETLFYSSKGYSFFKQILNTFNLILQFLIYYLLKLLTVLIPSRQIDITKPKLESTFIFSIIKDTFLALFFYSISIIIFIVSIYWLLTYVELLTHIGHWILSLFNSSYSILNAIKEVFNSLENWSTKVFSVNLFSVTLIWLIRIIGFCGIFLVRYLRLKKNNTSLELSSIIPYKKPFWDNQIHINSNYRVVYSIAFSVLIALLILGIVFFSKKANYSSDTDLQSENTEMPSTDSIKSKQTIASNKNNGDSLPSVSKPVTEKEDVVKINSIPPEKKEQINAQTFNAPQLKNLLNTALISIKAQEYDYSIKQLDVAANIKYLPLDLRKQIIETKSFIKAREDADAIKILNQIIAKN